ncbi:polyphosphate kinase 2 family protein [Methylobacterium nodulans]|uniref:Polyphosphate kinase-2-related domain-containing protein n=1 Tax=Methylobacterium nodulans (strain LMG 21967 / CNCM I-2342 / ORS 2060) TaxID=460265 RepID=B8ISN2_METNO|nr:polyphosphate kinase 2 family protein [Methylobacterium nodulans]ACL60681.1 protein of unknown function DUF344 [Methylobacterium nodulans ORS 2060]
MSKKTRHSKGEAVPHGPHPSSSAWAAAAAGFEAKSPGSTAAYRAARPVAGPGLVVVLPGRPFDLAAVDPEAPRDADKPAAQTALAVERARIQSFQERLYAEHRRSLLVVLQAIDTGGKDGTIRHVFEGVNPQGCQVWSFKTPSREELDHDFLWRYHHHTPGRGMIGVFNRSHYEDVLIARVKGLVPEPVWSQRYDLINDFERLLTLSGTTILKFFLHISRDEQKSRLESRLQDPSKRWKFDPSDLAEREAWDDYQAAFQDALTRCATEHAPWYVIPANQKWFRNLVVARTIADTLEAMNPRFPDPPEGLDGVMVPD